jgi:hypothetical protein
MFIPNVPLFQRELWAKSSMDDRIKALQDAESQLAEHDHRIPCQIKVLPEDLSQVVNGSFLAGDHGINPLTGNEEIRLNPCILGKNTPYQSVETLYHESEHAYQTHAVNNPQEVDLKAKVNGWAENKEVYFPPPFSEGNAPEYTLDNALYRYQPLEVDAENVAWARMDATYLEHFQDKEGYLPFRKEKMECQEIEHIYAQGVMGGPGTNVEEKAARIVHQQYQELEQEKDKALNPDGQLNDIQKSPQPQKEMADSQSTGTGEQHTSPDLAKDDIPVESEDEEENRYYGYGY